VTTSSQYIHHHITSYNIHALCPPDGPALRPTFTVRRTYVGHTPDKKRTNAGHIYGHRTQPRTVRWTVPSCEHQISYLQTPHWLRGRPDRLLPITSLDGDDLASLYDSELTIILDRINPARTVAHARPLVRRRLSGRQAFCSLFERRATCC